MEKTIEKGSGFIKEESIRIRKLLKKGKINDNKKQELETKINILKSFESKDKKQKAKEIKEEL